MVKLGLYIKADLENVTDLSPVEDYEWLNVLVVMKLMTLGSLLTNRGSANLVMRCKFCKRDGTAQFEPSFKIRKYDVEQNGEFQQIAQFDCRGLELVDFQPRESWTCKGTQSGTVFEEIDLCEGEWAEYDEKSGEPVGISNISVQFKKEK
ncbi:hypothetical protein EDC94DRAFT_295486 [Helicostylum pulchrum]|nr:hypothetical protein EDC94DRAFT_295486 [Helicostylum pulchrum]